MVTPHDTTQMSWLTRDAGTSISCVCLKELLQFFSTSRGLSCSPSRETGFKLQTYLYFYEHTRVSCRTGLITRDHVYFHTPMQFIAPFRPCSRHLCPRLHGCNPGTLGRACRGRTSFTLKTYSLQLNSRKRKKNEIPLLYETWVERKGPVETKRETREVVYSDD